METIAERIARGIERKSSNEGAIVPFEFNSSPETLLESFAKSFDATRVADFLNAGWAMSHYRYCSGDGLLIFVVLRFDKLGEKKEILPLRCERVVGCMPKLSLRHLDSPRPLYNLPELVGRPDAPVLVVEGEKAADAAKTLLPDYVCTTWIGGTGGVNSAELMPLSNRSVTIWPDNDNDGKMAAGKLAARLMGL